MPNENEYPPPLVLPLSHSEFAELVQLYRAVADAAGDALAERVVSESLHVQFASALSNEAISITRQIRTANT